MSPRPTNKPRVQKKPLLSREKLRKAGVKASLTKVQRQIDAAFEARRVAMGRSSADWIFDYRKHDARLTELLKQRAKLEKLVE